MRIPLAFAVLASLAAAAAAAQPVPAAVVSDPPPDRAFPAAMEVVSVQSHGSAMNGVLYVASGAGPHPTLLLLHGFPGNEQNLDLAQSVRRAGWNVLTLHYRGSWGSEGAFSFSHAIEDADAAIAFLRDPANAGRCRIDPARIAVAGHSMGGFMAAHAGAKDRAVVAVALISAWNIGREAAGGVGARMVDSYAYNKGSLSGCTPETLAADVLAHRAEWNFIDYGADLSARPLLLVTSDDGSAADSAALAAAARKAGGTAVTEVHIPTDHPYSDHRIALQAEVVRWLETVAPPRP